MTFLVKNTHKNAPRVQSIGIGEVVKRVIGSSVIQCFGEARVHAIGAIRRHTLEDRSEVIVVIDAMKASPV